MNEAHILSTRTRAEHFFAEALRHCLDQGMAPPFIVCVVAINASIQVFRFSPGEEGEPLAEHSAANGMMRLPINIMLVDQNGQAARFLIDRNGELKRAKVTELLAALGNIWLLVISKSIRITPGILATLLAIFAWFALGDPLGWKARQARPWDSAPIVTQAPQANFDTPARGSGSIDDPRAVLTVLMPDKYVPHGSKFVAGTERHCPRWYSWDSQNHACTLESSFRAYGPDD